MTVIGADLALAELLRLARVEAAYRREAAQLDASQLADWFEWLHDDFRYEVPIPVTSGRAGRPRYSEQGLLAVESKPTIALWIDRLSDELVGSAYAENPPVRTRRFISNVRVEEAEDMGALRVSSNILLSWNQRGEPPMFVTAERCDMLVGDGDKLMLHTRRVLLDSDVVHISHLRVIF
ncbi:aromatic-ring-hydroxylating dioxygenase subunit beta [Mycolicibacterium stellerae]|uniref:aromatic-ring-hydroxylating dioxygenase subunit beta n=1 Tax=Mycolicibacterium stellerae TaxID=2358193 RepID=UPI000F0B6BB4|nr:aromatic-ring-hydroxylating dioxygenase subunit beta [Mycolicibacterium stellerae]